jgi:hypothetical protein
VQLLTNITSLLLLMMTMSLCSLHAFAQTQPILSDEPPRKPVEKVQKIDFLYLASEAYLSAGTTVDMYTTANGLGHPTTAYRANGTFLTRYYIGEDGWAGCFGKRNTTGVISANVALNIGFDLLDRRLYRRGGRWRIAAITLNVLKGTGNLADGFHNIKVARDVDKRVRLQTGYAGRIIWSR